jgi:hypothetical protein
MWVLFRTNETSGWAEAGRYETVGDAVRQIKELESSDRDGLFLHTYVGPAAADDDVLGHFEYRGEKARYLIKRPSRETKT